MDADKQLRSVSTYYGTTLTSSADLKTSACCPIDAVPQSHRKHLEKLHPEVTSRFYGCGSPIPSHLTACTVLDLGCGTGRDVYLASALVGPKGSVIGVDMTPEQLEVANRHRQYHADCFFGAGSKSNVHFRHGYIEDLHSAEIHDASIDVVISNCVCNLSPHKSAVFSEVSRVLKQGGEFYFSDVYADRRLSDEAKSNELLVAECLGGALYLEDFRRIMHNAGFPDVRIVSAAPIELRDEKLRALVPDVAFYSITFRAFKISQLEDAREDYCQTATWTSCASQFKLDIDNVFDKGVATPIDSNTAAILQQSRLKALFEVTPAGVHRGPFTQPLRELAQIPLLQRFRPTTAQKAPVAKPTTETCCGPTPVISEAAAESLGPAGTNRSCCAPGPDTSAAVGKEEKVATTANGTANIVPQAQGNGTTGTNGTCVKVVVQHSCCSGGANDAPVAPEKPKNANVAEGSPSCPPTSSEAPETTRSGCSSSPKGCC